MKRRREMEKKGSELRCAIEELAMVVKVKPVSHDPADDHGSVQLHHPADTCVSVSSSLADHSDDAHHITSKAFLSVCGLVLQVLDKIGPTMTVLRQDIHQNIQRLEMVMASNPSLYSNVVEILKKEKNEGNAKKANSCSRSFVWLTRALDFSVALLQKICNDNDPGKNMEQAVEESYNLTLKPWHGWISSAAFRVALKLVPDRQTLISILKSKDDKFEVLQDDLSTFISLLVPFLEEIHCTLRLYSLDRIKSA